MYLIAMNNSAATARLLNYFSLYFSKTDINSIILDQSETNFGEKLFTVSEKITKILLTQDITQLTSSVCFVVFNPVNVDKINHQLINTITADSIVFDNLDQKFDKNWLVGSTQSVAKLLLSANKMLDRYLIDRNLYLSENHGNFVELVWYAQRIGFKVYEA